MVPGVFSSPPVPVKDSLRGVLTLPASWISFEHYFTLIGSSTGRAEAIREFFPRSYDFSARVQGAVNVDPQGAQRAFDQILHAALRTEVAW